MGFKLIRLSTFFCMGFMFVTLAFWMGGFNFDRRGDTAAVWFITSCVVGAICGAAATTEGWG